MVIFTECLLLHLPLSKPHEFTSSASAWHCIELSHWTEARFILLLCTGLGKA